jgi:acyl-CoA reductase-like NAD-dependent aldehyde dehydrogenase
VSHCLGRPDLADETASYTWLMAGECERLTGEIVQHGELKNMKFFLNHHPIGPVAVLTP